ncbi:MAG: hypothetical protein KAH30_06715 [Caldisericia bacterium]|nr:hypothetical protein [Caldisericia bacterium]
MGVIKDLEELRDLILNARKSAFSETVMIPQKKITEILDRVIVNFPIEFEDASEVIRQREAIIKKANDEAESIKLSTDASAQAEKKSREILDEAQEKVEQMKSQAVDFIKRVIDQTLVEIKRTESILEESKEGIIDADI